MSGFLDPATLNRVILGSLILIAPQFASSQIYGGGTGNGGTQSSFQSMASLFYAGDGHGFGMHTYNNPVNLFRGASGSGFNSGSYEHPVNIFRGGTGHGNHSDEVISTINLYAGGNSDGYAFTQMTNTVNMFTGGSNSGFTHQHFSSGTNMFIGGNGDGHEAELMVNTDAVSLYGGSSGHGFAHHHSVNPHQIFRGGHSDGWASSTAPSSTNLFVGGSGHGHADAVVANSTQIFLGGDGQGYGSALHYFFGFPLPVTWVSFEATRSDGTEVHVKWEVIEHNNAYFELLRSYGDTLSFLPITTIDGSGTSQEIKTYSYVDSNTANGLSYYLLKQIDFDGSTSKSKMISVPGSKPNDSRIHFYPNPAHEYLHLRLDDLETFKIQIFNASGQLKLSRTVINSNAVRIHVGRLADGVYILRLQFEDRVWKRKLVIKKIR